MSPLYSDDLDLFKQYIADMQSQSIDDFKAHLEREKQERIAEFSSQMRELYTTDELDSMWEAYSFEKQIQRSL